MWPNRRMDRQTDKKRTNEQMEFHQFRKEPSYDGDLSPCLNSIGQTVFELESGNEKCGRTDRWTEGRRTHQSNRRVGYM